MANEIFIAFGSTADAYQRDFSIDDVEKEIEQHYAPSLVHKEFDTEEQMRGFQDGLEFCSDECGYGSFWVIVPDNEEERKRLIDLSV
jgi:hypothetical protein